MKKLSRRQFIASSAGLALALAIPGCGWLADKPIAIAAHVWPGYEPMFLARSEGWLDAEQVRLVETTSATGSLQALADGKVDGAALTLDEVLRGRAMGLPLSVVMVFDVSAGADVLIARPGIKKLADLKGRRIGYEPGALGALMLAEALRAAHLTQNDVKPVPFTIDKQHEAWMNDQVDALITYEPVSSQLLSQGAVTLFDSRRIPNTIIDVLAVRGDILDQRHAAAIRHLLSAHFRALDHLNRNPQDAAFRMASHMNLPASDVLPAFKGLVLPDADNNRRLLTGAAPELRETASKVSHVMVETKLLPRDDDMKGLIHAEFLPSPTAESHP
ncbi:MAG TPA: ABC transporter substrate-binding protein [Gallionella sp.]|nr:ABC transporter substrate-binding protein [Gallionella sp.]